MNKDQDSLSAGKIKKQGRSALHSLTFNYSTQQLDYPQKCIFYLLADIQSVTFL